MFGVYFEIRNIPANFASKLKTRHLVALARVEDLKGDTNSRNKIAECIVKDLAFLETEGITVEHNINLKGALVNICSDNLGANSTLGLCESFNSTYYCRICECSKFECQQSISQHNEMLRSPEKYSDFSKKFFESEREPDVKETKGFKKCCPFNELKYFHAFENFSVDIMHDLLEGAVPEFIKILFDSLKKKNIRLNVIQALVRDFNYGFLSKIYRPSTIRFESNNLGQSARQNHCFILYLPFIFLSYKEEIPSEWAAMMDLIAIVQIVFSMCIRSDDLNRLNNCVRDHLSFILSTGENLKPKHHMLTHYSEVIKRMGPLIKMWMMRFESKHKVFTDMAHRTQNFINLPKSLAFKHQMKQASANDTYIDQIKESKTKYKINRAPNYESCKDNLNSLNIGNNDAFFFLIHNSFNYRPGLMVFRAQECFEIVHVLKEDGIYYL